MSQRFKLTYADKDSHSHIHGVHLGGSARAYASVGGFTDLSSGGDVAPVSALHETGARVVWSCKPRIVASVRVKLKAPGGFGATLNRIKSTRQRVDPGAVDFPKAVNFFRA